MNREKKILVFDLETFRNRVTKIAYKMPADADTVTGVYFSIAHVAVGLKGVVSLRFNEGISNTLLVQRVCSVPALSKRITFLPVNEHLHPNSELQGFYRDDSNEAFTDYLAKVYIEYTVKNHPCHE